MPCNDMFMCNPSLSCTTLIEADFYYIANPFMAAKDFERDPLGASTSHHENDGQVYVVLKTVFHACFLFVRLARAKEPKLLSGAIFSMVKHS